MGVLNDALLWFCCRRYQQMPAKTKNAQRTVFILRILKLTVLSASLRNMIGQEIVILSLDGRVTVLPLFGNVRCCLYASGWKRYCEIKDARQGTQHDSPQLA